MKKKGLNFDNLSLQSENLPFYLKVIPQIFHLKEIFSSKWLFKQSLKKKPNIIIYDKIFGWPKIKTNTKRICYNHGSYTLAGLTFKGKNCLVYLFYKHIIGYFEKRSYQNADKIIAVSKSVKNEMVDYFKISGKKIIVIDNGVDLNKFRPIKNKVNLRKKYGLPVNKRILLFPCRASFGKGFDVAENVLEKLDSEFFMIALGNGKPKLKNMKFIGKISNEKMPEVYNCADLTLFPSRYEGFGLGIIESAACGTPIILSKVGLIKTEKSMMEFECETVKEYVNKIKNLSSSTKKMVAAKKKWRKFSKNFSIETQVKGVNNFLKNLK